MKRLYLFFLIGIWAVTKANAVTTTTEMGICTYEGVIYRCYKTVESSDWMVDSREAPVTRGVNDGSGKTTYYAVVIGRESFNTNVVIKLEVPYEGAIFSVRSIESGAFRNDIGLHRISFPVSMQAINSFVCKGCINLQHVELTNYVYDIGTEAFAGCTSLESVIVKPDNNVAPARSYNATKRVGFSSQAIGESAFEGCKSLLTIEIPRGIDDFKNRVFAGCVSLKSVSLLSQEPASVVIPYTRTANTHELFAGCTGIEDVYVSTQNVIQDDTFDEETYNYATLHYPEGTKEAFQKLMGWKNFRCLYDEDPIANNIVMSDSKVKHICVQNWDTNSDGELSMDEAAAVTSIDSVFQNNTDIVSFEELKFFTGLKSIGNNAFYGCNKLQKIVIPDNVQSIGDYAFTGCVNLVSVSLPNKLKELRCGLFWNCESLPSITIPESINKIYDGAFANCYSLSDIHLPHTIESIGAYAFQECSSLTSIALPSKIEKISYGTFVRCGALQNITIPNSVKVIDNYAFYCCSQLSSVTLSSQLDSINFGAFALCNMLTSIVLPSSLTFIGEQSFVASGLSSFHIPANVKDMELGIVGGCTSLTSLTVDSNNPYFYSINNAVIDRRTNMLVQSCPKTKIPTDIVGIADYGHIWVRGIEEIVIPNNIINIGISAFEGCTDLKRVTIPAGIESIGDDAFLECTSLEEVTILNPKPVAIADNVFHMNDTWEDGVQIGTSDFTTAILYVPYGSKAAYQASPGWRNFQRIVEIASSSPNVNFADVEVKRICVENWDTNGDGELSEDEAAAVQDIGEVFKENKIITSFDEFEYFTGVTMIANSAFLGCSKLRSVTIPINVSSIGQYQPFSLCIALDALRVALGNKSYDSRNNCNAIIETSTNKLVVGCNNTIIPQTVTAIGDIAFSYCPGLSSLTIPEGVKSIGIQAFWGCTGLRSIHIPASVTSIGKECFVYAKSIEKMTVAEGNTIYDSRDNCNAIIEMSTNTIVEGCMSTRIPNTITTIGDAAFAGRIGLQNIEIPRNVISIGENAFYYCPNLTSISIPSNVRSIGDYAFEDCEGLKTIYVYVNSPFPISDNVFNINDGEQIYKTASLFVPYGTKSSYGSANGWKNFKNIMEMESKTLTLMVNRCEREYGEDNPNFTYSIVEGGSFTGEPMITCEATKTSPVGIYPITISKGNIEFDGKITFINANLNVSRATLTIIADDKTMTAGDAMPELTVTYIGFKNNETEDVLINKPILRTTGTSSNTPGEYPIYVSGAYAENYRFDYVNGKLTIKKKEVVEVWNHTLVLNFKNGSQKKYMLKDMSDISFSDRDLIVRTKTSSYTYRRTDILEFKFINATTDYDHVTLTADSYSRQYGEMNPKFTFKVDGANFTGLPTISCEATNTSPVGTYPIVISQGSIDNDNTTFIHGTLTIMKAPLIVTADDKKIVQGDNIPELTVSYDGFVNEEAENVLLKQPIAITDATSESEPGEYTIKPYGGEAENYDFYYVNGKLVIEEYIAKPQMLIVHLTNGRRERFLLSDSPVGTFSGNNLVIKTYSVNAIYNRLEVKELSFEEATSDGIEEAIVSNELFVRQTSDGHFLINGLVDGGTIWVYDLKGILISTVQVATDVEARVQLPTRKGVYIINIDNKRTIKIQKK